METIFDPKAGKKATNLSVNADLLAQARALDINLSATLERALAEALRERHRERWLAENAGAIEGYNGMVEEQGVFSAGLRGF
ncbi:hypothetical protein BURK2_00360 [Burkholderiales bacterium]|nr:MAG: acetoacetyl-CoA synthase [Burkholderiales bacterium]CAG0954064.1 hypothetical protein BURK2_00360 [Burkholderiales bacterium]